VGRWLRVGHELRGAAVVDVWARPDNPLIVLALCAPGGLWRSLDGGQSWAQARPAAMLSAFDAPPAAAHPGRWLVILGGKQPVQLLAVAAGEALWRSADDGETWAAAETDVPPAGSVTVLAPVSYHIDTALAGTAGGQVYQSSDRGRSWQLVKDGLPPVRALHAARLT
jgi:photosystem II stability/assembly factor-like uncharacterized protein